MAKTSDDIRAEAKLQIERFFTRPGHHPFDEIEWDIRDARIGSADRVAFEQTDIEFPKTWSQNATNIVAQKYFRGPMNTPQRERSVRQMIGRVVDWYTNKGGIDGYLASVEDAETFNNELTYLLVNQNMAFNSPVWFNVGLVDPPRVSACFILDVEDEMPSILNWYVEEGLIFKAGSGAGINLSKLRSSKEQLTSGGTASGPVSFMRGADASAGTIKSGGSTRRAAKMVVLDVDHPDVEEFINCKVREEDKARVLREAGFDMDLDGSDSHSLQYQNANNSVGLTDEFIQAYIEDRDWELKAVKDGRTVRTVKARDIMRQIAEAAWKCADPGVFYLGTMNQWHTSPSEGPIRATNPCGEFVRPANTSCNLASLRLTKFLGADGEFDVAAFTSAVETTLTAMDISVTNAEYPTERITKMVANYRELGIGYTDLGALLMDRGIAYDSETGRAWAAAITALMSGVAYRRSAELASALGPYPGWKKKGNPQAHLDVVRRHRDSLDSIDGSKVPADILEAARTAWDQALALGETYGYRNAQVSLLAPTGTISFLMDADTTGIEPDLALVKTKKLVGGGTMKIVNQRVPQALKRLGYAPEELSEIISYISENNSV
ncbi:MAG TPA: vitamin B12-dependent ribonucleotide reductase, partial [Actinomycetota bacterium]|nr:vitamin B12-dependent ribonucleotide reductase [Actinomycetota bacterium]